MVLTLKANNTKRMNQISLKEMFTELSMIFLLFFFFSGRLFVEASIHDEFVQRVVSHPEAILLSKCTSSYDKKLAVKQEHVESCIWFYNRWKK